MFLEQMKHFVAVVRGEVESACKLEDGVRVQQLVNAIHKSNAEGRIVELN
jgi:predicted dehydrogenase